MLKRILAVTTLIAVASLTALASDREDDHALPHAAGLLSIFTNFIRLSYRKNMASPHVVPTSFYSAD
jgi:hypothetical protein